MKLLNCQCQSLLDAVDRLITELRIYEGEDSQQPEHLHGVISLLVVVRSIIFRWRP